MGQNSLTPEEYEKAIPECCSLKTYDEHADYLMLCWGLVSAINNNREMNCGICEYAKK